MRGQGLVNDSLQDPDRHAVYCGIDDNFKILISNAFVGYNLVSWHFMEWKLNSNRRSECQALGKVPSLIVKVSLLASRNRGSVLGSVIRVIFHSALSIRLMGETFICRDYQPGHCLTMCETHTLFFIDRNKSRTRTQVLRKVYLPQVID